MKSLKKVFKSAQLSTVNFYRATGLYRDKYFQMNQPQTDVGINLYYFRSFY